MWAETTEFLKAHPIAGAGLASYSQMIKPYRIDKWIEVFHHPHNIFLTMWVNIGLLGLFAFVWLLVWFFKSAICPDARSGSRTSCRDNLQSAINTERGTRDKPTIYIMTSMTIIIVMGLVDSPYIKNDLAILFWLLPALLIISETKNPT
jgi:O-antigen ligase